MLPDLKILRWKAINIIFKRRLINSFSVFKHEQDLLSCVSWIFDIYLIAHSKNKSIFSDRDQDLFDDIILIAINLLKESTFFDLTSLNPVSFLIIVLAEHCLKNNPHHTDFKIILLKMYWKLGCKSWMREIG